MLKAKKNYNTFKAGVFELLNRLAKWGKKYLGFFFIFLGVGVAVYFLLMAQNLVTSGDGVKYYSVAYADTWERSIGRWFWPILDEIRFGIVSSPFNSIITLSLFSIGCVLLIDLFKVEHKLHSVLIGTLIIATPLVCNSLALSYMSVTFGLAFLLSIVSAYCIIKIQKGLIAVVIGAFVLAFSMGNYQAYFGVTCLILLVYFIKNISLNVNLTYIRNYVIKSFSSIIAGGILYQIFLTIVNNIYNVTMASYKNADMVSFKSIILNLPQRIVEAYKEFFQFFFTDKIQMTNFGLKWVYLVAFAIMALIFAFMIYNLFRKSNIVNGCLMIFSIACLPLASNAILLITESPNGMLTTGGLTLLFPIVLCLFEGFAIKKISYVIYFLALSVMLWVNVCIVNNDQIALLEGRTSTVTIVENIASDLLDKGYLDENTELAFMGTPSDNSLFTKSKAWIRANNYAKFGNNLTVPEEVDNNSRRAYDGIFKRYLGLTINFCSDETFYELSLADEVKAMSCYPTTGSIKEVDGVVVVKVADY